jgi:hypothetical protein
VQLTCGWSEKQANSCAVVECISKSSLGFVLYPPITYYWTVLLILDHSYLVGKLTGSEIADKKVSWFLRF